MSRLVLSTTMEHNVTHDTATTNRRATDTHVHPHASPPLPPLSPLSSSSAAPRPYLHGGVVLGVDDAVGPGAVI